MFAGHTPGFEPALVAPEGVRIGLVDGLLQLGDCRHLVGQRFVVAEEISEADLVLGHRTRAMGELGLFAGHESEQSDSQLDPAVAADREEGEDFASAIS